MNKDVRCFFSIFVAAYNIEAYIRECLDSVLSSVRSFGRSDVPVEIIIVDDGSTDNTGKIADEYAASNPIIRVIHQNNRGASAARNAFIMSAQGEYYIFVDGDDALTQCAVSSIYEAIKQSKSCPDVVAIRYETVDTEGIVEQKMPLLGSDEWRNFDLLQLQNILVDKIPVWEYCIRAGFLKDKSLLFEYGFLYEDEEFTPRVILMASSIAQCSASCYCHKRHRTGSLNTGNLNKKNQFYLVYIAAILWGKVHAGRYGEEQVNIAEDHIRRLYLKAAARLPIARHTDYYKETLRTIDGTSYILANSTKVFDRLYYIAAKIFGIRTAVMLLLVRNRLICCKRRLKGV